MDTSWIIRAMMDDRVVLRMHIKPSAKTVVEAHAFCYWVDDMAYNGMHAIYRHSESGDAGILPIECLALDADPNKWPDYFEQQGESWLPAWHKSEHVICTIGNTDFNLRRLRTTHPQVMVHLARFQGALSTLDTSKLPGIRGYWNISVGITVRRLEGMVRESLRSWHQMVDQYG